MDFCALRPPPDSDTSPSYEVVQARHFLAQLTSRSVSDIVADLRQSAAEPPAWAMRNDGPAVWARELDKIRMSLQQIIYRADLRYQMPSCLLSNAFWTYLSPIVLLLGSLGNILCFVVLWTVSDKIVSTFVYLMVLSVADQLVLVFGLARTWLKQLLARDIQDHGTGVCRVTQFLASSSSMFSAWLIVAVTMERAIVISAPMRAHNLVSRRRAVFVALALALTVALLNVHFLFSLDLVLISGLNSTICEFKPSFPVVGRYWVYIDALLYSVMPFLLITVLNLIIMGRVFRADKARRNMIRSSSAATASKTVTSSASSSRSDNTRQISVMLLVVSGFFLLTTAPIFIVKIISLVANVNSSTSSTSSTITLEQYGYFRVASTIAELLMYVNHAMNFYLYCASGHKFRQYIRVCWWAACGGRRGRRGRHWNRAANPETDVTTRLNQLSRLHADNSEDDAADPPVF